MQTKWVFQCKIQHQAKIQSFMKSKSKFKANHIFMTVFIKANPIQIRTFQSSPKLRVGRGYKKAYVGVREMNLEKRV